MWVQKKKLGNDLKPSDHFHRGSAGQEHGLIARPPSSFSLGREWLSCQARFAPSRPLPSHERKEEEKNEHTAAAYKGILATPVWHAVTVRRGRGDTYHSTWATKLGRTQGGGCSQNQLTDTLPCSPRPRPTTQHTPTHPVRLPVAGARSRKDGRQSTEPICRALSPSKARPPVRPYFQVSCL